MSKGLVQNYSLQGRSRGTTQTRASQMLKPNIHIRQTIRVIRGDKVVGERCESCSGFSFRLGKGITPTLSKEFKHRKGCRLA